MTIDQKVEEKLADARKYANEGNIPLMLAHTISAGNYAQSVEQDISAEVAGIKETGYKNAVVDELRDARRYALDGNLTFMHFCLKLARSYAQKVGPKDASRYIQRVSTEVASIEASGYFLKFF